MEQIRESGVQLANHGLLLSRTVSQSTITVFEMTCELYHFFQVLYRGKRKVEYFQLILLKQQTKSALGDMKKHPTLLCDINLSFSYETVAKHLKDHSTVGLVWEKGIGESTAC